MEALTEKQKTNFWKRVNKETESGCWEWTGTTNCPGYGRFPVNKKSYAAHRLSYVLSKGAIPEENCIMHQCDNRRCVNPAHLKPGTHAENMADMKEKGRAKGHKKKKLTQDQIKYILESGKSISVLTAELKVHPRTVERVRERYELVEETEETIQTI